jgi:hypothetical protein
VIVCLRFITADDVVIDRYTRRKTRLIESNAKMSSFKKSDLEKGFAAGVNLSEAPSPPICFCLSVLSFYAYTECSQNIRRENLKCDNLDGSLQTFRKD